MAGYSKSPVLIPPRVLPLLHHLAQHMVHAGHTYRSFAKKTGTPQQALNDLKHEVPPLSTMSEDNYVLKFPGIEEYLKSGEIKKYVPNMEIIYQPTRCK